jgi:hypothetical protein
MDDRFLPPRDDFAAASPLLGYLQARIFNTEQDSQMRVRSLVFFFARLQIVSIEPPSAAYSRSIFVTIVFETG